MGLFGIIASIVGVVGIGGAIALAVFAPLVFATAWKAALAILGSVWDTQLGMGLIVGAVCLAVGAIGGDNFGEARVRAEWHAADEAAKAKVVKADDSAAVEAEHVDNEATAAETTADQSTDEARNAYRAELEKRAACLLTDDDLSRLRDLR